MLTQYTSFSYTKFLLEKTENTFTSQHKTKKRENTLKSMFSPD